MRPNRAGCDSDAVHALLGAGVTDERFYSKRELAELLCAAGLRNVRVFGYGDVAGIIGRISRSVIPDIPLPSASSCAT